MHIKIISFGKWHPLKLIIEISCNYNPENQFIAHIPKICDRTALEPTHNIPGAEQTTINPDQNLQICTSTSDFKKAVGNLHELLANNSGESKAALTEQRPPIIGPAIEL